MSPELAVYNPVYLRVVDTELFGQLSVTHTSSRETSDFAHLILGQLRGMYSFATGVSLRRPAIIQVRSGMSHILTGRYPFKVIGNIVGFIAVFVINLQSMFVTRNPSESDDPVKRIGFFDTVHSEPDTKVSVTTHVRGDYSTEPRSPFGIDPSYATEIADFVVIFISRYWCPLFGLVPVHKKRAFCV